MAITGNIIDNNALASLTRQAGPKITSAIRQASTTTGVNFSYLISKAAAESSFNPDIKASTSSATGLFQFIESTWMDMVKKHGHKYGLGALADKIDDKGRVPDDGTRKTILEIRKDPEKAALMAAEYAAQNKRYLEQYAGLKKDIGPTELYFAHFMGAGGASAFLKAHEQTPLANAADLFPREARANRNVFYDPETGKARTLAGVYKFFNAKFDQTTEPPPQSPVRTAGANPGYDSRKAAYRLMQNHITMKDKVVFDFIMAPLTNGFTSAGSGKNNLFPGFGQQFFLGPEYLSLLSQATS